MATPAILGSATLNYQLTAYAQGLWNDLGDVIKLAERLAPTTPVPGAAGQFKKFDDKNSFMAEKTARALGGDPVLIAFNASDDSYSCKPQALEVRVDKEEEQSAGMDGGDVQASLLDQGKIRALVNKVALSHVLNSTTPVAGTGTWSDPNIDPIDQLNQQLLGLAQDCGSTQNVKMTMDLCVAVIPQNYAYTDPTGVPLTAIQALGYDIVPVIADNTVESANGEVNIISGAGGAGQYEHLITTELANGIVVTTPIDGWVPPPGGGL